MRSTCLAALIALLLTTSFALAGKQYNLIKHAKNGWNVQVIATYDSLAECREALREAKEEDPEGRYGCLDKP